MPLLLRHLMPLLVIGALFLISLLFALTIVFCLGRMFGRRVPERSAGPLIEGSCTVPSAEDGRSGPNG